MNNLQINFRIKNPQNYKSSNLTSPLCHEKRRQSKYLVFSVYSVSNSLLRLCLLKTLFFVARDRAPALYCLTLQTPNHYLPNPAILWSFPSSCISLLWAHIYITTINPFSFTYFTTSHYYLPSLPYVISVTQLHIARVAS